MNEYHAQVVELAKLLRGVKTWLDKAEAHAKAKSFETSVLINARLAPDQFTFVRQVQTACDNAKFIAARTSGREAPKHADTEKTFDELRARIDSCTSFLDTFEPEHFEGADKRKVPLPFLEGKALLAGDYMREMALPNFYFHLVTAYAILRHNGVELGKRDFLAKLSLIDL